MKSSYCKHETITLVPRMNGVRVVGCAVARLWFSRLLWLLAWRPLTQISHVFRPQTRYWDVESTVPFPASPCSSCAHHVSREKLNFSVETPLPVTVWARPTLPRSFLFGVNNHLATRSGCKITSWGGAWGTFQYDLFLNSIQFFTTLQSNPAVEFSKLHERGGIVALSYSRFSDLEFLPLAFCKFNIKIHRRITGCFPEQNSQRF